MAILHFMLLTLTFIVWTRACKDKIECFSKAQRGRLVNGNVLKTRDVTRFSECLSDCGRHNDCKSLNYNKFSGKCELMDKHAQSADQLSLQSENKHFINSVAPTTPTPHVCVENPCGHNEVCYEYKQNNRICLPECGEPPIPSGGSAETTYAYNDVGQKRTTKCPALQTNVGNTERTCLSNKAWSFLECLETCWFWTVCSSWINDEQFSERTFTWIKGATPTDGTGPDINGKYLFFEATGVSPGETAAIHTVITIPANEQVCLSFSYHMYTTDTSQMGTLHVKTLVGDDSFLTDEDYVAGGNQGNLWKKYNKSLASKTKSYKIYIMAVRGSGELSDIAIDTVKLEFCA